MAAVTDVAPSTAAPEPLPSAAGPTGASARRPKRVPRRRAALTLDDVLSSAGSALASLALVAVLYEHVVPGSGVLGFLLSWFGAYLLLYGAVVAMHHPRPVVVERLVTAVLWVVAGVVLFALGSTVIFTFAKGWQAVTQSGFLTHDMTGVSPAAPLSQGGIVHAVIGTVIEVALAIAVSLPFGIGTAIYMSEIGGRLATLVRTVVEAMTALPEILAGLFVYVTLVVGVGMPKSGLAVSLAMAVTMVPIIARASEVALRIVPSGLREASHALGATHWRTVRKVVLPSARAGLATALILAVARGIGETAIVLINSGASSFITFNPTGNPMNSLPLFIYSAYVTHEPTALARAFGAAAVLLVLVLALFVVLRIVARDKGVAR